VLSSGDLLRTLVGERLVDQYALLVHPLLLRAGRRMFPDGVYVRSAHGQREDHDGRDDHYLR
jgi:dihydrofolate reductase